MEGDFRYVFTRDISIIHRYQQILINHHLKQYNIGSGQYIFLAKIAENPGISQKDLTSLVKIDKATTAKALKKLEKENYIYRIHNQDDMRYNQLNLTKKGEILLPKLYSILHDITKTMTYGLSYEEYQSMLKSINTIIKNIDKCIKNTPI